MMISDLIRAMHDAGAPFEAIVIAVEEIERRDAERDSHADVTHVDPEHKILQRREKARLRQQKSRLRHAHKCDIERDSSVMVTPTPLIPPLSPPDPQIPPPIIPPNQDEGAGARGDEADLFGDAKPEAPAKRASGVNRGSRLDPDWRPEPLTGLTALRVERWPEGLIETEWIRFQNHWLSASRNAAKLDWQKTWVNWLLSTDERIGRHGRPQPSRYHSGPADGPANPMVRAAIALQAEEAARGAGCNEGPSSTFGV